MKVLPMSANSHKKFRLTLACLAACLLAACEGGGDGTTAPVVVVPVPSWPSSGFYSPVIKLEGTATANLSTSTLSYAHASTPAVEYIVDSNAKPNRLGRVLYQGVFNASSQQVSGLTPVAYVDSPNRLIRATSLVATGSKPLSLAGNNVAVCSEKFMASNYTTPYASQIVVSTPGADGVCETADDAEALVSFTVAGTPVTTALAPGVSLGYFRSATTGLPTSFYRALADGSTQTLGIAAASNGAASAATLTPAGFGGVAYKAVQNLNDIIVYTRNGALLALNGRATTPSVVTLSALVAPDGWKSAGYDSNHVYAYLNTSAASSGVGTWRILSVSRSTLAATTLATGPGSIESAEVSGGPVLFTTVASGSTVSVLRISTVTGLVTPYLSSGNIVSLVTPNSSGSHLQVNISTGGLVSTQVINDSGAVLYTSTNGTLYGSDSALVNAVDGNFVFGSYIFAAPIGSTGFGGATATRYDIATATTRTLGVFPTAAGLGGVATGNVVVGALVPYAGFGGLFAARRTAPNFVSADGAAVYTYNTGVANSLTRTTSQVR